MAMQFLTGFEWPVPRAFGAAIAACRFEQGDVLYSHRSAYGDWAAAQDTVSHLIQVLDPPRTTRALSNESEGNRFQSNWASSVSLTVAEGEGEARPVTTTQGRLFSCLWHGDAALLAPEAAAPPPPALARHLHSELAGALPALRKHFRSRIDGEASLYLWGVDEASDSSRVKAARVAAALAGRFAVQSKDLTPKRAGLPEPERFHPSLVLRGVALPGAAAEDVEEALKALLYAPGEGRESKPDRFSLARHGLLVPLDEVEPEKAPSK